MKAGILIGSIVLGFVLSLLGLIVKQPLFAAVGLSLPFAALAGISPILRRLAIRNASRRPKETMLILLGSLLGTAIVTSSGVVGDTSAESINRTVYTQLGPVDLYVEANSVSQGTDLERIAPSLPREHIDGVIMTTTTGGAAGVGGKDPRALADVQFLEMPFDQAADFGGDPKATGIEGANPSSDKVIIGEDVADALDVKKADKLDLYLLGQKKEMSVERVLPKLGLAGLNVHNGGGKSYNLFLAPGTLAGMITPSQQVGGFSPITKMMLISNTGGVLDGRKLSKTVKDEIHTRLPRNTVQQSTLDQLGIDNQMVVSSVKEDRINSAALVGKVLSGLFLSIGSFTIVSGILLLINIFSMLAQERQSELGMLRALGLKRLGLVGAFSLEGFLYAIGSSLLGVIAGLFLGRVVVASAKGIFSQTDVGFDLVFHANFNTVVWGFVGGLAISIVTILMSSVLIARMNVIRAIRELPDPGIRRGQILGLIIGGLSALTGLVLAIVGLTAKNGICLLVGPALVALGLVFILRRWYQTRLVMGIASAVMVVWTIAAFAMFKKIFATTNPAVYVVQGLQLTVFAVAFISVNQEHISNVFRRFGGRNWAMIIRLGLAYPLARRGRTGLLLAMYSLVIFVLTLIVTITHVLNNSIESAVQAKARGADIEITPTGDSSSTDAKPFPIEAITKNPDVERITPIASTYVVVKMESGQKTQSVEANVVDSTYLGNGSPKLIKRDAKYDSDDAAMKAALSNSSLVVVRDSVFREGQAKSGIEPGAKVIITSGDDKTRTLTVAAVSAGGPELVLNKPSVEGILEPDEFAVSSVYVKVKPGVNSTNLARQLSGLYVGDRIVARTIRDSVAEGFTLFQQFLRLIQGYLSVGLLVGIAGLGVVMVRAVRERRRQIGMLRAIGFKARSVQFTFLAESALIAAEGILIGVALALIVLDRILKSNGTTSGLELSIPWGEIVTLVGLTFFASIAATYGPARRASQIPPAEALRIND